MPARSLALLAVLVLSLAACDSTETYQIGGTYSGVTEQLENSETRLFLNLPTVESGATFDFTALIRESTLGGGSDETSVSGTGTYDHPDLTLTVEGEPAEGTVSEDGDTIFLTTEAGDAPARLDRVRVE